MSYTLSSTDWLGVGGQESNLIASITVLLRGQGELWRLDDHGEWQSISEHQVKGQLKVLVNRIETCLNCADDQVALSTLGTVWATWWQAAS